MKKLLTLIIPIFGKEKQIVERTIKSATDFKEHNDWLEIVCVYKNSDKWNYDWLHENDLIDKVLIAKHNSDKRNNKLKLGIENSSGKYLFFLDSDDIILQEKSNELKNLLEQHQEDLLLNDYYVSDEKNLSELKFEKTKLINGKSKKGSTLWNANMIYKNSSLILDVLESLDDTLSAHDLMIGAALILKTSKIANVHAPFLNYIIYSISDSHGAQAYTINKLNEFINNLKKLNNLSVDKKEFLSLNKINQTLFDRFYLTIWLGVQTISFKTNGRKTVIETINLENYSVSKKTKMIVKMLYVFLIRCKLINYISTKILLLT